MNIASSSLSPLIGKSTSLSNLFFPSIFARAVSLQAAISILRVEILILRVAISTLRAIDLALCVVDSAMRAANLAIRAVA